MNKAEFISAVRGNTGIYDTDTQSDSAIMDFIYTAETEISLTLRVGDMVQVDEAVIGTQFRVPGPPDFIAADLVYDQDAAATIKFKPRDEFYTLTGTNRSGWFTKSGNFLVFAPDTEGHTVELHYFGDVPHLADADANVGTWLTGRHNSILLHNTLALLYANSENPDKASSERALAENQILAANNRYKESIGWGVRVTRKMRGFG